MARPSKMHLHKGQWRSRIGGVEYYFGSDERKARHEFYKKLAEHNRVKPTDGNPETVAGIVSRWLAMNDRPCYRHWLLPFNQFAGKLYCDEVNADTLHAYHEFLKGYTFTLRDGETPRKLRDETTRHYIAVARAVLRYGLSRKWIETLPDSPSLKRSQRKARDVAPVRLRDVLDSLGVAKPIFRFIASTGARPSEACRLTWADVRLDLGICTLAEHKTAAKSGKPRTLYLTPEAAAVLRALPLRDGPVFLSGRHRPYRPKGLYSILKRRGVTPYALRHTFAQTATDHGVTTDVLAKMLGHSDEATSKFYRDVRDARVVDVASRLRVISA